MATIVKILNGFQSDGKYLRKKPIVVRYTKDQLGETIRFQGDGIMIGADLKDIRKIIGK